MKHPQKNIQLQLYFGQHSGKATIGKMAVHAKPFKPQLYVSEQAGLFESQRMEEIKRQNNNLDFGRKNPKNRQIFLTQLKSYLSMSMGNQSSGGIEFTLSEMEFAMDTYRLAYWVVEGHSHGEEARMNKALDKYTDIRTLDSELGLGGIKQALEYRRTVLDDFVENALIPRNVRIADGFMRLAEESCAIFPRLNGVKDLKVVSLYGSAHVGISDLIKGGVQLSAVELDEMEYSTRLLAKLSRGVKPEELDYVKDLFAFTLMMNYPHKHIAHGPLSPGGINASFDSIGPDGAIEFLESISRERMDKHTLGSALVERFGEYVQAK